MVSMTADLARAAERRGLAFTRKMPTLLGHFDDGDDAGRVVILGSGETPETVLTAIPGTERRFEVPCACVTIAAEVALHLEIAFTWLQKSEWMEAHPRHGRRLHVCNPALH